MNLARAVEYAVQTGRSQIVSLERLFPLTRFGVAESGIDHHILGVVAIVLSLVSVAPWFAVIVTNVRGARMWRCAAASQPPVLARAKAGHECREGRHGLRFFLAEVSGEPLVADIMLKSRQGFGARTVDYLVIFS